MKNSRTFAATNEPDLTLACPRLKSLTVFKKFSSGVKFKTSNQVKNQMKKRQELM